MSCDCMSLDVNALSSLEQSLSNFLSTTHKKKCVLFPTWCTDSYTVEK